MTWPAAELAVILIVTLGLFIWGRLRPEVVALAALVAATVLNIIPVEATFSGFAHPAVITVAAVLVLSQALTSSGLVDRIVRPLEGVRERPMLLLASLTISVAILSAFINNVGALAVLMPVAIRLARKSGRPPSLYLMPLAFGSLLGGMTTLIGTPPNLIVSGFRLTALGEPFRFFAFAPVGGTVAIAGIAFMLLVGWRLVPRRAAAFSSGELIKVGEYLSEAKVIEKSPAIGKSIIAVAPQGLQILSIVRGEERIPVPSPYRSLEENDLLVMMGESETIESFVKDQNLELVGQDGEAKAKLIESDDIGLAEAVITPGSRIIGRSATTLRLRQRHGINLIGIAREGARLAPRLGTTRFRAGDVLLVQGARNEMLAELAEFGCLPLADRTIGLGQADRRYRAFAIFAAAIALVATGWLAAPVSFTIAVLLMLATGVISVRQAYAAIDWPILILLAAMIPVGLAIETTGLAALIARGTLAAATLAPIWAILGLVLVATMFLSDLVNNAAAAVMMCPVAIGIALGLEASPDPFLLAVAIGASCAFLTPIGHQSNLLVMGPGGYRFGDYWRLGLLLEVVIAVVAVPALMILWPPH
jgi:di/tricarboxylate transporter